MEERYFRCAYEDDDLGCFGRRGRERKAGWTYGRAVGKSNFYETADEAGHTKMVGIVRTESKARFTYAWRRFASSCIVRFATCNMAR